MFFVLLKFGVRTSRKEEFVQKKELETIPIETRPEEAAGS